MSLEDGAARAAGRVASERVRRAATLLIAVAACGAPADALTDAGAPDAGAPTDAPDTYAACAGFAQAGTPVPAHVTGAVATAAVEAPASCAVMDAPFGTESAGPDSVVLLTGLVPRTSYMVHLQSASDLLFYVATGCSTPTGPSSEQCLLFEDASTTGDQVGTFVAPAPSVYVIVDYYASTMPPAGGAFSLDVYPEACTSSAQCGADEPVCSNGACVACASSFDCSDPAASSCDLSTNQCVAAIDQCASDDANEPTDDGPAGATVLELADDQASHAAHVCSNPSTEDDFYAFDVTALGDTWDVALAWETGGGGGRARAITPGQRDLQLEIYDASGALLGMSYWEQPEHVALTYLPPGRYYARVFEDAQAPNAQPQAYTITAQRTPGAPCQTSADCAAEYRNQIYRGQCDAGACIAIDGSGAVPAGGACDSVSDCADGMYCASFYFVEDADTRDVCAPTCQVDSDCGPGFLCTTYLDQNFCVLPCTDDAQCPTVPSAAPASGPWWRLSCDTSSGRCLP